MVKKNLLVKDTEPVVTMVPESSFMHHLLVKKKINKAIETFKGEIVSANILISLLEGKVDMLLEENKELKKKKKKLCMRKARYINAEDQR